MGENAGPSGSNRVDFAAGPEDPEDTNPKSESFSPHKAVEGFWQRIIGRVEALPGEQLRVEAQRNQELPLARIKKIMKLDEDVKAQMISAEAPILFAVASQWSLQHSLDGQTPPSLH